MTIEERFFDTIEAAAGALAGDLADTMAAAISSRGRAVMAVSGGTTPCHVFDRLCVKDLDWSRVVLTLTDERWVAVDHRDSNEKLVRDRLLQKRAAAARFIALYGGEETPADGQAACESRLQALPLPFDAVYLGMGADGHFASLFPGEATIEAAGSRCVAVTRHHAGVPRLSLSAPTILEAGRIFLLFGGADKYEVYIRAKRQGPHLEIPLRLVLLQQQVPVSVLIVR